MTFRSEGGSSHLPRVIYNVILLEIMMLENYTKGTSMWHNSDIKALPARCCQAMCDIYVRVIYII